MRNESLKKKYHGDFEIKKSGDIGGIENGGVEKSHPKGEMINNNLGISKTSSADKQKGKKKKDSSKVSGGKSQKRQKRSKNYAENLDDNNGVSDPSDVSFILDDKN